jgi:hypothetical protein
MISVVGPHWFPCGPDPDTAFNLKVDPWEPSHADQGPNPGQTFTSQKVVFLKCKIFLMKVPYGTIIGHKT